jgi:hypothetical protein
LYKIIKNYNNPKLLILGTPHFNFLGAPTTVNPALAIDAIQMLQTVVGRVKIETETRRAIDIRQRTSSSD